MTKQDRSPDPIDVAIGKRVRARRREVNITQEALASEIGVTFQQVQKYERGTNRMSMSKFVRIAVALQTTPAYFLEGLSDFATPDEASPELARRHAFLASDSGVEMADLFMCLGAKEQRAMMALVRVMMERRQFPIAAE